MASNKVFYRNNQITLSIEEQKIIENFVDILPQLNIKKRRYIIRKLVETIYDYWDYWGIPIEYAKPNDRVSYVLQQLPDKYIDEIK